MLIFAHRGFGAEADENTVEAIRRAVDLGVDGIAVDVRRSRDDEAVLVHDPDCGGSPEMSGKSRT